MKKGYTLIELIILIVILAIIGGITLPIILTKINNSRKDQAKAMAYDVIESVRLYHYNKLVENSGTFDELILTCDEVCKSTDDEIKSKAKPSSGKLTILNDGTITGELSFYDGDYTFYVCNDNLFDEKIQTCTSGNNTTLKKADYKSGDIVVYAGLIWNVVKDNGEDTTLVLSNLIGQASLGGQKYSYEKSNVKEKINEWFDSNLTLKNAKEQKKLVAMKFSDGEKEYEEYVRVPSGEEVGIRKTLDKCNTSWCNIKKAYWLLTYQKTYDGIYKVYNIGEDGEAYGIDITNESGIRPVIIVKEV